MPGGRRQASERESEHKTRHPWRKRHDPVTPCPPTPPPPPPPAPPRPQRRAPSLETSEGVSWSHAALTRFCMAPNDSPLHAARICSSISIILSGASTHSYTKAHTRTRARNHDRQTSSFVSRKKSSNPDLALRLAAPAAPPDPFAACPALPPAGRPRPGRAPSFSGAFAAAALALFAGASSSLSSCSCSCSVALRLGSFCAALPLSLSQSAGSATLWNVEHVSSRGKAHIYLARKQAHAKAMHMRAQTSARLSVFGDDVFLSAARLFLSPPPMPAS